MLRLIKRVIRYCSDEFSTTYNSTDSAGFYDIGYSPVVYDGTKPSLIFITGYIAFTGVGSFYIYSNHQHIPMFNLDINITMVDTPSVTIGACCIAFIVV